MRMGRNWLETLAYVVVILAAALVGDSQTRRGKIDPMTLGLGVQTLPGDECGAVPRAPVEHAGIGLLR